MSQRVQIVKYAELVPCRTAFIDAHTPGSDQKENFTIIGGGVSESADQHVHIKDTPGFNIGAAGQSPKCRNSLHTHRTAEVFFVLSGRWRFFWGRWGDAGEVILEPGDIFNIPTGMFRGFENIGSDYGMIMAILGGDDAGGGVVWAPQVIEDAHDHGLILGENGKLYDRKKGEGLPANIAPMPVMTDDNLSMMSEPSVDEVVPRWVARYLDLLALSRDKPVQVIGEQGLIFDKPGFEVEFVTAPSAAPVSAESHYTVLMPVKGFWRLHQNGEDSHIGPGDTAFLQPDTSYELASAMSGEAGLYRIRDTNDPAGPSWWERN
ncbi:MAG: cupin domain-containing protein [Candidatus Puniceispirillaceae bacterium]